MIRIFSIFLTHNLFRFIRQLTISISIEIGELLIRYEKSKTTEMFITFIGLICLLGRALHNIVIAASTKSISFNNTLQVSLKPLDAVEFSNSF